MPNLTAKMIESLKPADRMVTVRDTSTRGLELYVTKAGIKTFSLRYSLADGTRRRMNIGRWPDLSLADARQMAMALMSKVALGQDPAHQRKIERSDSRAKTIRTLDDLAEALFEAAPSAGVRDSTLEYWKWLHRKHLKPRLGSTRLQDLAPGPARRELRAIGSEAGPTTSNRAHGLLRRVLNFGVEEEHIPTNPLAKLKAPGRIMSWRQVHALTGLSRSTIFRMMRAGQFPRSFQISAGRIGWAESAVNAWLQSKAHTTSPL